MPRPSAPARLVRRAWLDAPILSKGLAVIALPVVALVSSSALMVHADEQRQRASSQREAAEAVEESVGALRITSRTSAAAFGKYLATRDPAAEAQMQQHREAWGNAVDAVEAAALAQPDETLRAEVRTLDAASTVLHGISDELLAAPGRDTALYARASAADTAFQESVQAISEHAAARARHFANAYDAKASRTSRLILISGLIGAASAVAAMIGFTVAIRRRVRLLERNSRALGAGQPLQELAHSKDELGQLGSGLDHAADLLRDRAQELHEAADTLRRSEQRLGLALASGAMGTWDVDLKTGVSSWDAQTEHDHGLAPGAFGGTFEAWLDLVHPEDRAVVMSAGGEAMASGGRWTSQYRLHRADGEVRWIETSGKALLGPDGVSERLVGVSSDITERKLAQDTLRAAIEEAEQANSTKSEFLSRVSHELRTPLNAILGFGQLLEMDDLDPSQQESVDQVLRGGRHLLALIDDVLDISRIESGNLPMSIEATSLAELLSETTALVSGAARESGIDVVVTPSAWLSWHVRADRRRLKQIVLNLLSNAVKYNRPGGTVTLECSSPAPGVVRVSVTDTGMGIAPERLERMFTPFDRLGAESTAVDGTGIGLALSQRLAELMGTAIDVKSRVGEGSRFTIDLATAEDPLVAAAAEMRRLEGQPLPPAEALVAPYNGPDATVLYVEDNPSNFRLVQRLLDRRGGLRLVSAATGAMALSLAARMPVDVILLDLHLPDMHGSDVLRQLRENPATASTPIVVVTADASNGQRERLQTQGANGFLSKPFDLSDLANLLDTHLTAGMGAS